MLTPLPVLQPTATMLVRAAIPCGADNDPKHIAGHLRKIGTMTAKLPKQARNTMR
jgi:hypothetical protein